MLAVKANQGKLYDAVLEAFERAGGLTRPAYALSPGMADFDISQLVAEYVQYKSALEAVGKSVDLNLSAAPTLRGLIAIRTGKG